MRLTDEQKAFIICGYARFMRSTDIRSGLKDRWGIDVDTGHIANYNPESARHGLTRWRKLYEDTRAAFLAEVDAVPLAHAAYRMRELQDLYDGARKTGNTRFATELIQQAAREIGGAFTNKREGTVNVKVEDPVDTDQQRALVEAAIEDAIERLFAAHATAGSSAALN